jgi:hypothetical protein
MNGHIKRTTLFLCCFGVLVAMAHHFFLHFLVNSSISCFYQQGCVEPRWNGVLSSVLFSPLGLGAIWPENPEIAGWIDSGIWGLATAGIAYALLAFLRSGAEQERADGV